MRRARGIEDAIIGTFGVTIEDRIDANRDGLNPGFGQRSTNPSESPLYCGQLAA